MPAAPLTGRVVDAIGRVIEDLDLDDVERLTLLVDAELQSAIPEILERDRGASDATRRREELEHELETYRRSDAHLRGRIGVLEHLLERERQAGRHESERVDELERDLKEKQRDDAIAELGGRLLGEMRQEALVRLAAARVLVTELDAILGGVDTADIVDSADAFFHQELERRVTAIADVLDGKDPNRTRAAANGT